MELYLKGRGNLDLPPLHHHSHPLQSFNPANWKCQTHVNVPPSQDWGNGVEARIVRCVLMAGRRCAPLTTGRRRRGGGGGGGTAPSDTVPVITSVQQVSAIPCQSPWRGFVFDDDTVVH